MSNNSNIVGILLAAGSSTRFGSDKLLYELDDNLPLVERAAYNFCSVLDNVLIVTRPQNKLLSKHMQRQNYQVVENQDAALGLGTSIACGVKASPDADAWVIALGDMPFIKPATIRLLLNALKTGSQIVAPNYHQRRGHPVGFSKTYYGELSTLDSDQGARSVIQKYVDKLHTISVNDPGVCIDIDRVSDIPDRIPD